MGFLSPVPGCLSAMQTAPRITEKTTMVRPENLIETVEKQQPSHTLPQLPHACLLALSTALKASHRALTRPSPFCIHLVPHWEVGQRYDSLEVTVPHSAPPALG